MSKLYRFSAGGVETLVTDEFLTEDITYPESRLEEFRTETNYEADLDSLGQVLDWVMDDRSRFDKGDSDIDAAVAPAVRKFVDVPPRAAGDERIWHYLAVGWRPDYVRYRWPWEGHSRTLTSMREKFTVSMRDLYTPAFGRLWFMAEFTRQEEDYKPTEAILSRQYAANRLFDRTDMRQPEVVGAIARVVRDVDDEEFIDNGEVFEATAKAVSHELSTVSVESINTNGVEQIVREKFERASNAE